MIYKTLITGIKAHSTNERHQIVHSIMHKPDEKKPCPPFVYIEGDESDIIRVYSAYAPANTGVNVIVDEVDVSNKTKVQLASTVAAVRIVKENGKEVEKAQLADNKLDKKSIKEWALKRYAYFGLTLVDGTFSIARERNIADETHNVKKCPVATIHGIWNVSDPAKLEKLLLTKLGKRNYLGLGMTRIVDAL